MSVEPIARAESLRGDEDPKDDHHDDKAGGSTAGPK